MKQYHQQDSVQYPKKNTIIITLSIESLKNGYHWDQELITLWTPKRQESIVSRHLAKFKQPLCTKSCGGQTADVNTNHCLVWFFFLYTGQ